MDNKTIERTMHEQMTEKTYFDVRWLVDRYRPVNYSVIILVSIISSAITAWVITH